MNHRPGIRWWNRVAVLVLLLALLPWATHASEQDERRILIGLKLFPAVLAADADIAGKASPDGRLPLLLLYRTDRAAADGLAERLTRLKGFQGLKFAPIVAPYSALDKYADAPLAGIFVTERADDNLAAVIALGRRRHVVTFSPFESDVEQGVLCGLYVSDRILPYLNMEALRLSDITLKPFFVEVAKRYE